MEDLCGFYYTDDVLVKNGLELTAFVRVNRL